METELREFVHLNSQSVNSLLASQQLAIPETVRDVSEDIHEDLDNSGWGVGLGYEGIAKASYNSEDVNMDERRNLAETERRVNDQYLFSILHRSLLQSDQLIDIDELASNDEDIQFDSGDVVKISGSCYTDPLYRILNTMSSIMRIGDIDEVRDQNQDDFEEMFDAGGNPLFDNWSDVLHGKSLSLRLDSESYSRPIVMSMEMEDLWTESPEREFIDAHDYTVVGRVSHVISNNSSWNFVELFRLMSTVFSDESVDKIRDDLIDVFQELNESTAQDEEEMQFDLRVDREDFVIKESAVVIEPIAVYW